MPKEQFKAYFLALLADKEFTRIFDTISKVDKSFKRLAPYLRTQARGNQRFSSSNPRVTCYRCETPDHKSPQCWKQSPTRSRSQLTSTDISVAGSTLSSFCMSLGTI